MTTERSLCAIVLFACASALSISCKGGGDDEPSGTGTGTADVVGGLSGCGTIRAGQGITAGETFSSCNGKYTLAMQTDGNLVLYANPYGAPLWSTSTSSAHLAIMQGDGNFVLYTAAGAPLWASNTAGTSADILSVQDDGNVVISRAGTPIWSTNTCTSCRALLAAELNDFYVQDVCLDGGGQPTSQDPQTCPNKRDLALDEPVRFLQHDMPDTAYPLGHQATISAPIRLGNSNGGSVGVLHTFDYGGDSNAFLEYQPKPGSGNISAISPGTGFPSDGWDVLEHNGGLASYIGTADGGGGIQAWVHGPRCAYDDAWLLWDQSRVFYAPRPNDTVAELRNGFASCPAGSSSAYTWWTVYPNVTFTSGKAMDALKTHHFDATTIARAHSYEVDYYTKPYGRTRWEAWSRNKTDYTGHCNGDTADGQGFFRNDCRDWSYGEPIPDDGWYPQLWPVTYAQAKGTWLVNGDFGSETSNFSADGGMFHWSSVNAPSWKLEHETPGPSSLRQGNRYVTASPVNDWGSIYQDVPATGAGNGWFFAYGARIWSDSENLDAVMRVWRMRADGTIAGMSETPITVTPSRAMHRASFKVDTNDVARLRFEIYLLKRGGTYHIDDAFLSQT
jgi:hypothetical protein